MPAKYDVFNYWMHPDMALTELEQKLFDLLKTSMDLNLSLIKLHTEFPHLTDAAVVLNLTESVKEYIGEAIRTQFDPLKSGDIKRILGKPASPKGLAVQLDVAHALGILDDVTYEIATKILVLRNIFGHNKRMMRFHQEPALTAFNALHTNSAFSGTYADIFIQYVQLIASHLDSYMAWQQRSENEI